MHLPKLKSLKITFAFMLVSLYLTSGVAQNTFTNFAQNSQDGMHIIYLDAEGKATCVKDEVMVAEAMKKNSAPNTNPTAYSTAEVQSTLTTKCVVTYTGFTPQAQAAFQAAVDIWANLLSSTQTIRIDAHFADLGTNVLGVAGPAGFAQSSNKILYPIALADALTNKNNLPNSPAINATFSSTFNFYFGTDSNCPKGQYDFVTIVLHELGHGLGFIGSARLGGSNAQSPCTTDGNTGCWGYNWNSNISPFIFDIFVKDKLNTSSAVALINNGTYPNPSNQIKSFLTGNSVYFHGSTVENVNIGTPITLYAPTAYAASSSFSHFDRNTYPIGNPNALMAPSFSSGQSIHFPGALTCAVMQDIGWTLTGDCKSALSPTCTQLNIKVFLEGAFDASGDSMKTNLNQRGLLPAQKPVGQFAAATATTNPYSGAPWFYSGTETFSAYDPKIVDCVLVSLRTDSISNSSTAFSKLGILYNDGNIGFADSCWSLIPAQHYFVVVEHRNHIGVMSPLGFTATSGVYALDFSQSNSYNLNSSSTVGQKKIGNRWVMIAADGQKQTGTANQTINPDDVIIWQLQSGTFDHYLPGDYNLDGDVNFLDICLWKKNNSSTSAVPH